MREIPFYKYHGAGNDFILLDNREERFSDLDYRTIAFLCDRRFGIGADGFMLLERHENYPFRMTFFNSDGMPGSMCGNGGRCICAFAQDLGLVPVNFPFRFWSSDGEHEATVLSNMGNQHIVRLKMRDVSYYAYDYRNHVYLIDTGSPHYVKFVEDCQKTEVVKEGKRIRFSQAFPHGINVDFVETMPDSLLVRTYERGVEDETYSCGTGVTASSMAYVLDRNPNEGFHRIRISTKGGNLQVDFRMERRPGKEGAEAERQNRTDADPPALPLPQGFNPVTDKRFSEVYLEGLATSVFKGQVVLEDALTLPS